MGHISFDYSKALDFFNQEEIDNLQSTVTNRTQPEQPCQDL